VLLRDDFRQMFADQVRSLDEDRIRIVMSTWRAAGSAVSEA
jgi:hypothetical protein